VSTGPQSGTMTHGGSVLETCLVRFRSKNIRDDVKVKASRNTVNVTVLFSRARMPSGRTMSKPDSTTAVADVAQKHRSDAPTSISAMKARQCAKIADLRRVLSVAGYHSLDQRAIALGLSRSTTWVILQANHKSSGLSGSVIKRMLRSRELPPAARKWIEEYVAEKLTGAYGHKRNRLRIFRAQVVDLPIFAPPESLWSAPSAKPAR
jgi:hypothetical protein